MGRKRRYVGIDEERNETFTSVEMVALEHYISKSHYTDGRHCKGALIHALFILFFWDIIYDPDRPVPGTFLSTIQQVPLDMKSVYFYPNRKNLIDKRLDDIATDWSRTKVLTFLKQNYENHAHEAGIFKVDSVICDTEADTLMETLVDCVGRVVLSRIFQRLVKNVGVYRSGMPDLLIWNVNTKLVSTKSTNSSL